MTDLKQLGSFLDPILAIPYRGKTYEVQAVNAETGLRLQKLVAAGVRTALDGEIDPVTIELVNDADEQGFYETILGPVYDQLIEDKVSSPALKFIGQTALMWHAQDFEMAETFWRAEGKAPTPKGPQDHKPKTATRTRTAAASTTRTPKSANGTTTPKATTSRPTRGKKS